nr:hypothetical protein GCM10020063_017570 [Dactylosporangium thailandense]
MRHEDLADADCGIAQALGVMGDWWTFLIVRDIAGGTTRFDALAKGLGVSRRALTERLGALVEHGVLRRRPYSQHPPRHDYVLTPKGEGLLPVLVALQDWGSRHVMGDGSLDAIGTEAEARRVHALVGHPVPGLHNKNWTVLYCFPGAFAPGAGGHPPGWGDIPGATGCTLESLTYAQREPAFRELGADIRGISTQRPDQLRAFAEHARLPFPLLSDQDVRLAAALRLPTFRVAGADRLKRLTLLLDPAGAVRAVQFPITDPAGSVDAMLGEMRLRAGAGAGRKVGGDA